MPFEGKRVRAMVADDILRLIGVTEDLTLDFKREPHTRPYDLCLDVAAMANAAGGYIVIGITELGGRATELTPLGPDQARVEASRVRAWCHDGIRPRVPDLEIGPVDIQPGQSVVVLRIPASVASPHMVTVDHRTQFCRRYQDGNREMTFEEIRAGFLGDSLALGIEALRVGVQDMRRTMGRERDTRTVADPNTLTQPETIQDFAERQMRRWMERED